MKHVLHALCILSLLSTIAWAEDVAPPNQAESQRIGIYDSRAVAVAFAGSDYFKEWMLDTKQKFREAEAQNDSARMKELKAEGAARQKLAHELAFSTAPVDGILVHIQDKLPGIMEQANVVAIVSKWDKESLARYGSAEQVDVTSELVDALKPNEQSRKWAVGIMEHEPIPLVDAEKIDD